MANVVINDANLVAIGDAIRAKNGTANTYKPREMADAITNLPTGGGGADIEPIVLTGKQDYGCSGWLGGEYIKRYGNTISTVDVEDAGYMFQRTSASNIPFAINFKTAGTTTYNMGYMFISASKLEELPIINNARPYGLQELCSSCNQLKEVPENWVDNWDLSYLQNTTSASMGKMFHNCSSLRKIPTSFFQKVYHKKASISSYYLYSYMFGYCYNLDEIKGMSVIEGPLTSDTMASMLSYNSCLKSFTFATNEDGTAKIAQWKSQMLNLSTGIGYYELSASYYDRDYNLYNSGRTVEDCIYDDATYQLNKNNPNAYVAGYKAENPVQYSRYNRDSAVETINSLPDCSAYCGASVNTIKFKGASGSATDGGAINTLTEEEIAVATAKGWTVSLV